jgi:hypothetical protein
VYDKFLEWPSTIESQKIERAKELKVLWAEHQSKGPKQNSQNHLWLPMPDGDSIFFSHLGENMVPSRIGFLFFIFFINNNGNK